MSKLGKAEAATDAVVNDMVFARERLEVAMVNGLGVLADPSELRSRLLSARSALDKAVSILDATDWPRQADYDAVDG